MLISVVVPCYNQEHFIAECLESVLAQYYDDWECLVVNDGSSDNTASIVESFCAADSRITLYSKPNGGVSSARNFGILKASGYLILPLDGDDRIGNNYLAEAQKQFTTAPDTALFYAQAEMFGNVKGRWLLPRYSYSRLLLQNCIYCAAIFKKDDFLIAGGYDENMKLGYEDWEFWIRLLDPASKVVQLEKIEFYYRQRNNSRNSFKDVEIDHRSVIDYVFKKHYSKYLLAAGLDCTIDSFRENAALLEKNQEFKRSFTYKTIYKIEKEWRRFIKRYT